MRVQASGLDVHYRDDYFGPQWETPETFVLQAGYAANSNHFAEWVPGLADRYRVVRRDSVGHGLTSPGEPDRDLSLEQLADDMVAFFDALGLDSVHYVGERTGAMTGVVLAAKYPDRVKSLTLYGCPIVCGKPLQDAMWSMLGDAEKAQYTGWCDAVEGMGGMWAWSDHVKWLQDETRPEYSAWQTEQLHLCDEDLLRRYAIATIDYDLSEYFAKVEVPTLILGPSSTYRTNLAQQLEIRDRIKGSQLEIVEGGWGRSDDGNGPRLAGRTRRFLADFGLEK